MVHMPEGMFDKIKQRVQQYYPRECGGVFVGRISSDIATIEKMMMPLKIKSSPVLFIRIADFINKWLTRVFNKSEGRSIYLGEWHSHPNGYPYPSSTDLKAMKSISENSDVRITTPLLLIVGYRQELFTELFYIYYNQKLLSYEKI